MRFSDIYPISPDLYSGQILSFSPCMSIGIGSMIVIEGETDLKLLTGILKITKNYIK